MTTNAGVTAAGNAAIRRGAWSRWVTLLDTREGGESLALIRILAGWTLATHLIHQWVAGAVDWVWLDIAHGGTRNLSTRWLEGLGGATPTNIHALTTIAILAGIAMFLGAFTRYATFIAWGTWQVLANLNANAGGSYDELFSNVLFLLLLSDSGRAWSVDARWRGKTGDVPAWPRWLIALQLVVMYDSTAWQKLSSGWVLGGAGDALWYILQQPTWHRTSMTWLWPAAPLLAVATQAIWCFEHASPLLVLSAWYRRTRVRPGWLRAQFNRIDFRAKYLGAGVLMHLGIEASMEVGPFILTTMCCYLAWFAPDEVRRFIATLRRYSTGMTVKPST